MREVVWAISTAAAAAVGLLFCAHWRRSRDRFFVLFAVAFWALGASTLTLLISAASGESRPAAYIIRLLAFLLIIVAILDKNRPQRADPGHDFVSFGSDA
jgi:drug/metabolite transporter superfamily protein YnfA